MWTPPSPGIYRLFHSVQWGESHKVIVQEQCTDSGGYNILVYPSIAHTLVAPVLPPPPPYSFSTSVSLSDAPHLPITATLPKHSPNTLLETLLPKLASILKKPLSFPCYMQEPRPWARCWAAAGRPAAFSPRNHLGLTFPALPFMGFFLSVIHGCLTQQVKKSKQVSSDQVGSQQPPFVVGTAPPRHLSFWERDLPTPTSGRIPEMEADLGSATGQRRLLFPLRESTSPSSHFPMAPWSRKIPKIPCLLFSTPEIHVCVSCHPVGQGSLPTSVHLKWQCRPAPGTSAAKPSFHAREQILTECLLQGSRWDCSRQKTGSKCTLDRNTSLRPTGSTTASKRSEQ